MNIYELLENVGLDPSQIDDPQGILEMEVMIHFQPNYPLKGKLENARLLNGELVFAAGDGYEYGSKMAWSDEADDDWEK